MTSLEAADGDDCSFAQSINSGGQIVGLSFPCAGGPLNASLWQNGSVTDLNIFVPVGSALHLTGDDIHINDRGEIAGSGLLSNGDKRFFTLTPVSEGDIANESPVIESKHQTSTRVPHGRLIPKMLAELRARLAERYHIPGLGVPRD